MPKVSVVIPLYNKAPHIVRAIDSVLAQSMQDFEIVVVDDGSTDNGGQVVASYTDPRIRLIRQENQGVSAARNRGIVEAQSDFIAFLDADDEWEGDHLEVLLRLRNNFPEAGAYSTAYSHVYSEGEIVPAKIKKIPPAPWEGLIPDYFLSASYGEPPVWSSAVAIPREIFDHVGFFKVGEKMGEDLDMWGRIALIYPICFSWNGVSKYYKDDPSRACIKNKNNATPPFLHSINSLSSVTQLNSIRTYKYSLLRGVLFSHFESNNKYLALKTLFQINPFFHKPIDIIKIFLFFVLPFFIYKKIRLVYKKLNFS